jgi:hypothetical protein
MTLKYMILCGVVSGIDIFRSYGIEKDVYMYPPHIKEIWTGNCDGLM